MLLKLIGNTAVATRLENVANPHCSGIRQWGNIDNANGITIVNFPIAFKNTPFIVNCAEHSAMGWNTEVAIGGADASRATNMQVAIYSKWVTAAGVLQRGQNVEWFTVGI